MFQRRQETGRRLTLAPQGQRLSFHQMSDWLRLLGSRQPVQKGERFCTMLLREAHFCQVQVSVAMMCVEGQHTPEETCCHFRIARGQIVISEIVQQSGRVGSNFQGAPVESFRRRVPLVGIKDHPHETKRTHIAWMVSQHRVQCYFGFSAPSLLERPLGILINGVRNLLLCEDDKDRENRADCCENPNSHTRTATARYAAQAPKPKMNRITLPFTVTFALP